MTGDRSVRNKFVSNELDRLAELRTDEQWRERVLDAGEAVIAPVWRNKMPVSDSGDLVFLKPNRLLPAERDALVLLGSWQGDAAFALDVGEDEAPPPELADERFDNLRTIGAMLPGDAAALAAYAMAMVFWHRRHRHCGVCGSKTAAGESGHVLVCTNKACAARQFPRSDPAVIVLTTYDDRALLGRQASWPAGVYSTIAGFVEPGESLENAVRREVAEETGVVVDSVRYHSSQPWPFPSSLMLGFHATASTSTIRLHDKELEHAQWFSREDIVSQLGRGMLALSAPISIAYRLIEHWFDDGEPGRLAGHLRGLRG